MFAAHAQAVAVQAYPAIIGMLGSERRPPRQASANPYTGYMALALQAGVGQCVHEFIAQAD